MEAISCFQERRMRLGEKKKQTHKFSKFTKEIIELESDELENVFPDCPTL